MQIYGLNGIGRVADIPGAVAGGQQYKLQKDAIDEKKRLENTTWLAGAAHYALQNWDSEERSSILQQLDEEGKRRGILSPQSDMTRGKKSDFVRVYQGARTALGGIDPMAQEQKDERTSGQKDYEYAVQNGFKGSFEDWQRVKKPDGTTVNVQGAAPKPEKGFRNVFDDAGNFVGQEPVPGSDADRKRRMEDEAAENKSAYKQRTTDLVSEEINRALATMESGVLPDAGFGAAINWIPGTDARRLKGFLTTIKGNIGFDKLQALRDASPTGGALGQVSNYELQNLQAVIGDLEQDQDPETLSYNLKRLYDLYQDTIHGSGNGPQRFGATAPELSREQQAPQAPQQDQSGYIRIENDQQFDQLPSGTLFIGPDGQLRQKP